MRNGYNESFNGKLRDELLNGEIFYTLKEATIMIERWRVQYSVPEERKMMEKYSTCNAMVRDLIAKGEL